MFYKFILLVFGLVFSVQLQAQYVPIIDVPDEIEFAGLNLKISNGAKKIIQQDITNITKNSRYFQSLVDRANLYFPLIEKVFDEENFPRDFKYLALQESSLVSDAVSSSNAVGYWQFKKESAIEVGVRVDNRIDERMNIIAASRGASRYLKRNNRTLDNWIYALLSYHHGLGGVQSEVDPSYVGASKMKIDEKIHWYVLRFLAHKLVYQHAIGKSASMDSVLVEYVHGANKSLHEIATENNIDKDNLGKFNKWLKSGKVPDDKIYSVMMLVPIAQASSIANNTGSKTIPKAGEKVKKEKFPSIDHIDFKKISEIAYTLFVNGVRGIVAGRGDNSTSLSAKGGISKEDFLKYNEMKSFEELEPSKVYYLSKKRKKALVLFHTVQYDETLWSIAQNYGITVDAIKTKNRMDKNEAAKPGRVLWIRAKRPKAKAVEYKEVFRKETIIEKKEDRTTGLVLAPLNTQKYSVEGNTIKFHEVVAGETMFGISKKYQVSTDSIMEWNGLVNYSVSQGQKLIVGVNAIPKVVETTTVSTLHEVTVGETYYSISKLYNVSIDAILLWNNKKDLSLKLGEKLIIQKTKP